MKTQQETFLEEIKNTAKERFDIETDFEKRMNAKLVFIGFNEYGTQEAWTFNGEHGVWTNGDESSVKYTINRDLEVIFSTRLFSRCEFY